MMPDPMGEIESQTDSARLYQLTAQLAWENAALQEDNQHLRQQIAELERALRERTAETAHVQPPPDDHNAHDPATWQQLTSDLHRQADELRSLYALLEHAPDAIAIAHLDTGLITYANPAFRMMFGFDVDVQVHFLSVYAEPVEKMHAIVAETTTRGSWQGTLTYKRCDGRTFSGQLSGVVLRDTHGQPWAVAGIVRDITQQQEDKRQVKLLEALIEHTSETVLLSDLQGTITYVNPSGARMHGTTPAAMIGQNRSAFHAPEERERIQRDIFPKLMRQGRWEGRVWSLRPDGTRWLMQVSTVLLQDTNGFPFACASVIRDATAEEIAAQELRRLNNELAQAARLKDEFLASMSHELRTPLNAILGMTEALQEGVYGALTLRQLDSLHMITESGQHLLTLINDMLDLAKIEAGKMELNIAIVSIEQVCRTCLRLIQQEAARKRLIISASMDTSIGIMRADERRLKQILLNLLNNAVKFTPAGGQLGLEVGSDGPHDHVSFTVWDTGIGIALEDQERLFLPFVQLDSGLTRAYEGTGLGLTLVTRLVALHGGGVQVVSNPGQGSRFTVTLPRHPSGYQERGDHPPANPDTAPVAPVPPDAAAAPLILLAEDNESNILVMTEYLHRSGYRVQVARNGNEAVMQAQQERPGLILMDIQMPLLDGLEAMRRIRADVNLSDLPIIALTALVMPGDRERCMEAGANVYLSKPVGLKALTEVIQQCLAG